MKIKHLGSFLLITLILIKVSAFHVYEHHDDHEDKTGSCEFCLFAIDSQQSDLLLQASAVIKVPNELSAYKPCIISQDFQISRVSCRSNLFYRPPPSSSFL
ncbi:hypothetical protein [Flagellimonas eckloniae]|uniref:hypothetical protein n=1 Tax=Flagellimonas eckloniae TaxID=346185 RepID=UPI001111C50E|nr:hypothetical protein [Allomuricauda eckloniae]